MTSRIGFSKVKNVRKNKEAGSGFEELERTINKTRGGKKKYEVKHLFDLI